MSWRCSHAAYFEPSRYTMDELAAAMIKDVAGENRLLPVRVEEVTPPRLFAPIISVDLFGIDEPRPRERLLRAARGPSGPPEHEPLFPGRAKTGHLSQLGGNGPALPGPQPRIWNIPSRSAMFTGRDGLLLRLRQRLTAGNSAVVQALHGMGGIGKTQLAVEYAYRFSSDYEFGWWIDANQPELIGEQLGALAIKLGVASADASTPVAWEALLGELRTRVRWLLVFDDVQRVEDVQSWLPSVGGHVVITSRRGDWRGVALPLEITEFARAEAAGFLKDMLPALRAGEADRLAERLDDLPLALAQAVGLMKQTGMPVK